MAVAAAQRAIEEGQRVLHRADCNPPPVLLFLGDSIDEYTMHAFCRHGNRRPIPRDAFNGYARYLRLQPDESRPTMLFEQARQRMGPRGDHLNGSVLDHADKLGQSCFTTAATLVWRFHPVLGSQSSGWREALMAQIGALGCLPQPAFNRSCLIVGSSGIWPLVNAHFLPSPPAVQSCQSSSTFGRPTSFHPPTFRSRL